MNRRAGLFRAWTVATVCWIGGITFIGIQTVPKNLPGSKYIYVPWDERRYIPYNPPPAVDDGRMFAMDDGTELFIHRSTWQYGQDQYVDPIIDEFWHRRWRRYWTLMRPWLLLLSVPGLLFILVYAMMWIFDGFGAAAG